MGNNAVNVNGFTNNSGTVDNHITARGSSWLFAVCALMGATALGCFAWSLTKPRSQRLFFYLCALLNFVACIAYFTLGSNLGWAAIPVEFVRSNPKVAGTVRQIFYVRYIDWFITTPLLLTDLLLTAAVPWSTIAFTIFMDEVMVVTGLLGALVRTRYKWGFYVLGCAAFLWVAFTLVVDGRRHAKALGSDIQRVYLTCGVWTLFLWFLYPIAWGLCEGGNVISSDSEAVFYGVLDVLAKPVFSILLLWGHRNMDLNRLGLHLGDLDDTSSGARPHGEKSHHNGVTNSGDVVNDGTTVPTTSA